MASNDQVVVHEQPSSNDMSPTNEKGGKPTKANAKTVVDDNSSGDNNTSVLDLDQLPPTPQYGSVFPHFFSHPEREQHWRDVYESCSYEGRHRFDASFTWSGQSERLLKRKVGLFICR